MQAILHAANRLAAPRGAALVSAASRRQYTTRYDHNAPTMPIVHPPAKPPKRDLAGDELALQSSPITPQAAIRKIDSDEKNSGHIEECVVQRRQTRYREAPERRSL